MQDRENEKRRKEELYESQLKELNSKIDMENDKLKHNDLIREELENINASYNRCLQILSKNARGKAANRKYNELYTMNKRQHIHSIDELDKQSTESKKKIDSYYNDKEILEEEYEAEREKKDEESSN